MKAPTERQLEMLRFIHERSSDGLPPTLREIGSAFGLSSTNGVNDHLKRMERKGLLRRLPIRSRGLKVSDAGLAALGLGVRECWAQEFADVDEGDGYYWAFVNTADDGAGKQAPEWFLVEVWHHRETDEPSFDGDIEHVQGWGPRVAEPDHLEPPRVEGEQR